VTRRGLQIALGILWLLDGVLQLQPFMLGRGFATQIVAPAGDGQPAFVAVPVHWAAGVIAAHPTVWDLPFAAAQLSIGVGLLVPRCVRAALAASIAWALAVWYLGEGLSGIASGHASLMTGAPGSALLLALLGAAAWPRSEGSSVAPARWLPLAWAALWVGGAVFQALPGQNTSGDVAASLSAPGTLAEQVGRSLAQHGTTFVVTLVVVEALIGLGALYGPTRAAAAGAGVALASAMWVLGQDLGGLASGQATDPNSAPLIVLAAFALLAEPRTPILLAAASRAGRPEARAAG
jgi:hypothetical protein